MSTALNSSPFITLCLESIGMCCVLSESVNKMDSLLKEL